MLSFCNTSAQRRTHGSARSISHKRTYETPVNNCAVVCGQAAEALLYPLSWQRIFLPVVPERHRGLLASPPAFLAGCPASVRARLTAADLPDGCVELDADCSRLRSPHGDLQRLPTDVVSGV